MTEVSELDDMVYMLVQEEENDEFDFVRSNLQWKNKYVYVQKKKKQTKILELRNAELSQGMFGILVPGKIPWA